MQKCVFVLLILHFFSNFRALCTFKKLLCTKLLEKRLKFYLKKITLKIWVGKILPDPEFPERLEKNFFILFQLPYIICIEWKIHRNTAAHCSKIRKKVQLKKYKKYFCTRKKFKTPKFLFFFSPKIAFLVLLNFFRVQKLIFCLFWKCK